MRIVVANKTTRCANNSSLPIYFFWLGVYFANALANTKMTTLKKPVLIVLGSTGSGKSDLALAIAQAVKAHIINADAMQLFEGLPIGTNKPTSEEAQQAPHHLINFVSLQDANVYTVQQFRESARQLLDTLERSIMVGGTNYYIRASIIDQFLMTNDEEEEENSTTTTTTITFTHERLQQVDPEAAKTIHPKNDRKIKRALLVYDKSQGKQKFSELLQEKQQNTTKYKCYSIHLQPSLAALDERINKRVLKMVERGLIQEVQQFYSMLKEKQVPMDFTRGILQSIGFKEFVPYLQALDQNSSDVEQVLQQCISNLQQSTRQYARKQLGWYKNFWASSSSPAFTDDCALFNLDASDASKFASDIIPLGISIAKELFFNEPMTDAAKKTQIMQPIVKVDKTDKETWKVYHCDTCDKSVMGPLEWQKHIDSRIHKKGGNKKRRKERRQQEQDAKRQKMSTEEKPASNNAS